MMNKVSLLSALLHTDGPGLGSWLVGVVAIVVVGAVDDNGKTVVATVLIGALVVVGRSVVASLVVVSASVVRNAIVEIFFSVVV